MAHVVFPVPINTERIYMYHTGDVIYFVRSLITLDWKYALRVLLFIRC
jgi:hypothetical protein